MQLYNSVIVHNTYLLIDIFSTSKLYNPTFFGKKFPKGFHCFITCSMYDKYQNAKESFRIDVCTLASCD